MCTYHITLLQEKIEHTERNIYIIYIAFRNTSENHIVCISAVGPNESIGGDIKLSILNENKAGGLVTDGSVRDLDTIERYYNFAVWGHNGTCKQGPATQ